MSDQEKMREECEKFVAEQSKLAILGIPELLPRQAFASGWQSCAAHYERQLGEEQEAHAQLQSRCFDGGGSQSVFDRVAELQRQLAAAQTHIEALKRIIDEENKDHIEQQAALQATMRNAMSYIEGGRDADAYDLLSNADTSALDRLLAEERKVPDVGWLANVIRSVDGANTLGAGILAEKIVAMWATAPQPEANKFRLVGRCVHGKAMWAVETPESQDLYVIAAPQPEETEGKKI